MPARIAGKRGRQRAKRLAMPFIASYTAEPLPAAQYPVDVSAGITAWGMLGNGPDPACTTHPDGVGDCTFAGRQHYRLAKAAAFGETETWEDSNDLVAEYLAYDNGQDEGAVISDLLMFWYQHGAILGFAPVDHADPAAVDAAMQAFHGVYVGVDLTDDADQLFSNGQPWTVANGEQPDPDEGHCIVKVKADGHSLDGYVSWGALQPATLGWSAACLQEAWVIITSEDEAAKIDLAALQADIEALGGTEGTPPPAQPAPPEPQSLLEELAGHIRTVAASAEKDITELLAFLASHGL